MSESEYDRVVRQIEQIHGNQIFRVRFRRRTDKKVNGKIVARAGDERVMNCRLHVTKGVTGKDQMRRQNNRKQALLTVYEMGPDKFGFKCIPVDSIIDISFR